MIIGIDFGNINSFPAYVSGIDERTRRGGTDVFLLPANQGRTGIPSLFHFRPAKRPGDQDTYSYGFAAQNAAPAANRRDMLKRHLHEHVMIAGRDISYDDMITGMIKHIVDVANEELVEGGYPNSNKISLAYPVVYTLPQKEHLKKLAERAVLRDGKQVQVMGMIQEPAAAALEYLATLPVTNSAKDYTVLVYDLGGGTFDAAVVTAHQDANGVMTSYEVLEQSGLSRAGNEFTDAMLNLMIKKLRGCGARVDTMPAAMDRLRRQAEDRKCTLSEPEVTFVEYEHDDGSTIEVTRAELEEATESLVSETIATVKSLYNKSSIKPTMLIMTGGQSQMPIIRTRLQNEFPSISKEENIVYRKPQQAIALGAARFGHLNCETKTPAPPVILRTSKMLGTPNTVAEGNSRRFVDLLIPKNTPIPMKQPITKRYVPTDLCRKQTVYLSEAVVDDPDIYNDAHFTQIATLTIDFNTVTPKKTSYELSTYIDQYNQIHFSARDPEGKFKTVSVEVEYTNGGGGNV